MLSCVSVTRGTTEKEIWFAAEPKVESIESQRKELFIAFNEIANALDDMGIKVTP